MNTVLPHNGLCTTYHHRITIFVLRRKVDCCSTKVRHQRRVDVRHIDVGRPEGAESRSRSKPCGVQLLQHASRTPELRNSGPWRAAVARLKHT